MSTTFTAPTRTRPHDQPATRPEPRRSFTEHRRAARRAAADRSLRAQLVKGRSLVQLVVNARGKESRWPFVAAFALIAGVAIVALLMVNTATAQTSFTEQKLSDELHDLKMTEQELQQEVAAKQAPGELAKNAQELGMQPGSNPGNLVINPDGSVTWIEPTPPPAPPAPAESEPEPTPAQGAPADQQQTAQDQAAQDQAAQNQTAQDQAAQDQAAQNQAADQQAQQPANPPATPGA